MNEETIQYWEGVLSDEKYRGVQARHVLGEIVRSVEYRSLTLEDKLILMTLILGWIVR